MWCPRTESNRGPIDYKSIALPAELQGHYFLLITSSLYIKKHAKTILSIKNYLNFLHHIKYILLNSTNYNE